MPNNPFSNHFSNHFSNPFSIIKQVLIDNSLLKDLYVTNYKKERITLDSPLNDIQLHLNLHTIFTPQFLSNNDHVLIKLQLWLEEANSHYEYLYQYDDKDLIDLENLPLYDFLPPNRYFNDFLKKHFHKNFDKKLLINEVIMSVKRMDTKDIALAYKLDFVRSYVYKYIYWPWLLTNDTKVNFKEFLDIYKIDDPLLYKVAMVQLSAFFKLKLIEDRQVQGKGNFIKVKPSFLKTINHILIANTKDFPMISKPLNWVPFYGNKDSLCHYMGGYYRKDLMEFNLIRPNLHKLELKDSFLDTMNNLQSMPLSVNQQFLNNIPYTLIKRNVHNNTILRDAKLFDGITFYLPYFLDWRGRMYSKASLSQFGGELARNQISFNQNIKLNNSGLEAIKVYAGTQQKLDLSDVAKVSWFDNNIPKILKLSITLCKAAKDPLTFYNLCLHFKQYEEIKGDPLSAFNFNLHLDVNSSTILHIGCLLRNNILNLVNLNPERGNSSIPINVYKLIINKFILSTECAYGPLSNITYNTYKTLILMIIGNLDNKSLMYNMVENNFMWNLKEGTFFYKDEYKRVHNLQPYKIKQLTHKLIDATFTILHHLNFFHITLNKMVLIASIHNSCINWATPLLKVSQYYPIMISKSTPLSIYNRKYSATIKLQEDPLKFDKDKSYISLIANLTQSQDATHTNLVLGGSQKQNILLLPVHDSFIFHPNFKDETINHAAHSLVQIYKDTTLITIMESFIKGLESGIFNNRVYSEDKVTYYFKANDLDQGDNIGISISTFYKSKESLYNQAYKLENSKAFIR